MPLTTTSAQPETTLRARYARVRDFSRRITETLAAEDCVIQSMPDVSPTRWHLAHTTWFFETFVLQSLPGYRHFHPDFGKLFNSYYNSVGKQFPRARRGLLSRPTMAEVYEYRAYVDEQLQQRLSSGELDRRAAEIIELGLQHEQQHQELMLTDIKHVFSCSPLYPQFRPDPPLSGSARTSAEWRAYPGGMVEIGFAGEGFSYDNESPRHKVFLQPYALSSDLVRCGDYLHFMQDGGYQRPELWLSMGWALVQEQGWEAPLYWVRGDHGWQEFTMQGLIDLDPALPVCHVSYFEADAFARWAGARLPTEAEWEAAAAEQPCEGNFADELMQAGHAIHPTSAPADAGPLRQAYGDVWEWTASAYLPYPGYQPPPGALGEYNGKFMCNQFVLRGGSCATPSGHIRATYRNFFPPDARWQFSGIRLARHS